MELILNPASYILIGEREPYLLIPSSPDAYTLYIPYFTIVLRAYEDDFQRANVNALSH